MQIWFWVKERVKEGREDVLTCAQSMEASARPLGAQSEGPGGLPGLPGSAIGWGSPRGCGLCAHERWVLEPSSRALGRCC